MRLRKFCKKDFFIRKLGSEEILKGFFVFYNRVSMCMFLYRGSSS